MPDDVIILKLRSPGCKTVSCHFYDTQKRIVAKKNFPVPDNGSQNEYVIKLPDLNKNNVRFFRIVLQIPPGKGNLQFSRMQIFKSSGLNIPGKYSLMNRHIKNEKNR